MAESTILMIEDDEIVTRTIERAMRGKEYRLIIARSGVEGLKMCRSITPDLVLLDVIMPGMDGYTVCREIRNDPITKQTPVILITAKVKDEDKATGFNAGADDYICKPFNLDELFLRIRAVLRRANNSPMPAATPEPPTRAETVSFSENVQDILEKINRKNTAVEANQCLILGEIILDTRSHELYTSRGKLLLTPVQFDLLYHLMSHPGQVFSPARLLDEVWGYPSHAGSPDLVRVHIKNLRERIEDNPAQPQFIRTVPGYGYTISAGGD
jgi:DNA-binding response OmpR family regulator